MNKRLIFDNGKKRIVDKKTFNNLFNKKEIVRLCGVHNALMSSIVEEAGFEGVWLSSFEYHASARLPDADILTISDYSQIINKICDRITIPLLVDGDAGGGSPINTIRMVREYEKNGASGLCIEDNKYPKRCSFYGQAKRELENPKVHAAKIRAACDNRINDDFLVVARTEALIVGLSMQEAIDRANIYKEAGVDAILIHHKGKDCSPVFEFSKLFGNDIPLVCVPTTYNTVTEKELIDNGFKMVIYANYGIRGIVKALKKVFSLISEKKTLSAANEEVVPMSEIFRLVAVEELYSNEEKYSV